MKRLEGKVAVITGAASVPGLGSASAQRFAAEGAILYLTDRDGEGVERVAAELRGAGTEAVALAHDVTREADWDRVFATVTDGHGRLDVLVNNAGIAILKPIEQITSEDWRLQTSVNLDSVFYGTKRAVASMRQPGVDGKPRGGSIVNMSSVIGLFGVQTGGAYGAAKGGVRMFSKSVALECATQAIRVNTIHPGLILTNMQGGASAGHEAEYDAALGHIPMGHMGDPADIANMIVFLASDESRYVTGAEFVVDGGMTAS